MVLKYAFSGGQWSNQTGKAYCDNEAAISVLKSGYSRDSQIMHLLHYPLFIKAHFQIEVKDSHIPRAENVQADAISNDLLSVHFS